MAFHRVTPTADDAFIRGAGRLLIAPDSQAWPVQISDVVETSASPMTGAQWDPKTGWTDLGATKTGIQITVNNAEETFDVDQVLGDIESAPTSWEVSVGTQLAEATLERMQVAWEGSAIATNTTPTPDEKELGVGEPTAYTRRRLAVLFQKNSGLVRAFIFRKVQRMPQESSITFQKTGEQISIPVRWRSLADTTVSDTKKRFFSIYDQITP
jgi:hypothetical protein